MASNRALTSHFTPFSVHSARISILLGVEERMVGVQNFGTSPKEAPLSSCSWLKQCLDLIAFADEEDPEFIRSSTRARCSGVNFSSKLAGMGICALPFMVVVTSHRPTLMFSG